MLEFSMISNQGHLLCSTILPVCLGNLLRGPYSFIEFHFTMQGFKRRRLERVARYHKHGRFPVVVWQHAETHTYLLRGAAFQTKSILSTFKQHAGAGERQSATSTSSAGKC